MNDINFTGNLYFDKSLKKLSPKTEANVRKNLRKYFGYAKVQKAIPEDVYVSASGSKKKESIFINIKDADDFKYQIDLSNKGNDPYLLEGLLYYIFNRYNTEPIDYIKEFLEGKKYIFDRVAEILKNF